jgi:anti-anti-sigma factor
VLNVSMPARRPDGAADEGGHCAVVSLAGQAAIDECAWYRDLLEFQAARSPDRIVINLSGVSSMDWWAVLILMWVARVITRRGGTLVLACPRPPVAQVLSSAQARQVIPVYGSLQQATDSTVSRYAAR